jgi:outer membrane protein assembly factor BamB
MNMMNMKKASRIRIMWWLIICSVQLMGAQGTVIRRFGEDRLMLPRQICLAGDEVYVLDEYGAMTSGDEKIVVFTLNGDFKMEFGRGGAGPGEFGEAIAIDVVSGKIYILDSLRLQIHIFSQKEKKFLESRRILRSNATASFTTPSDLLVTADEQIYLNTARFLQGQKLIAKLIPVSSFELKVEKDFLDCIPLYKDLKERLDLSPAKRNEPDTIRKSYLNKGYITNVGNKIYFTYWLINKVYELSMTGALLNQYTLPVQSIDKTVKVKKSGIYFTLDHKLNYSLISDKNQLYVMSRDINGDTLIFQLVKGQFTEICRIKEMLFGGAISGKKLFAIGGDESEIVIYDMNTK